MRGRSSTASRAGTTSGSSRGAAMAFKQELLRNLLLGLRERAPDACSSDAMSMTLQERRRTVKRAADVAMAAARGATAGRARWPKAILAAAADTTPSSSSPSPAARGACRVRKSTACKRVLIRRRCWANGAKRSVNVVRRGDPAAAARAVARRMVKRRTMALRKVTPGGHAAVDEASLLRETVDYVVHLRAQVDVLRLVSEAAQAQRSSAFLLGDPCQSMGESSQ
ncbi:hypothetical protein BS78_10G212000 [Paspalum vaginatum]|nr:hypothetical protein BS78_10G212000 [Paspalum vaginatum]